MDNDSPFTYQDGRDHAWHDLRQFGSRHVSQKASTMAEAALRDDWESICGREFWRGYCNEAAAIAATASFRVR